MLEALRIRDLAVIESLEMEFEPGFSVLTGETGAGKSILVDALTLVLGGRATSDYIRSGAESAEVEALFRLHPRHQAVDFLSTAGLIEPESIKSDQTLEVITRRVISRSGRNRVWINGKLENTGALFELGRRLVDIYGQHEYQTLLRQDRHRALLDSFGGLGDALESYRREYQDWRELERERRELDLDEKGKREREDMLRYRISEIGAAGISTGEDAGLEAEREVLRHAELLRDVSAGGVDFLYESEEAVVGALQKLSARLGRAAEHDRRLGQSADQVDQAASVLEEVARELRSYADAIEVDPDRLGQVEDRIDLIKSLKKKYGETIEEVLDALDRSKAELENLERGEDRLKELESLCIEKREAAAKLASALSAARMRAGKDLARRVERELASMGMEKTRFEVRVEPLANEEGGLGPEGADAVEFYLSPNPGEDLKPLARIASGGELSRIMLALRVLLAGEGEANSLVFDEVDQGIGGAVAQAVGERMKLLAGDHQVLCVTHLPQISALAHRHFKIEKRQTTEKTWVEAGLLDGETRVEELARMLGGKTITDAARTHAREMIEMAEKQDKTGKRESPRRRPGAKVKDRG